MPARILGLRRHSPASSTATLGNAGKRDSVISLIPPYISSKSENNQQNSARTSMDRVRKSVVGHSRKTSSEGKGSKPESVRPARVAFEVESPPILFHNGPDHSTGAIFSGQATVDVAAAAGVTLESFNARFVCATSTKRPVVGSCQDCVGQTAELKRWDFLTEPRALPKGVHKFPLTHLLPGHLPATTHSQLGNLEYRIMVEAKTSTGETFSHSEPVTIKRAILPTQEPRKSMRIFPPTELTAHVSLQPVVHPIGDIPIEMRLEGTTKKHQDGHLSRWRLRRLSWRIEERSKGISPACPKHVNKVSGEATGIPHEDARTVADAEMRDGWKTDLVSGSIDIELRAAIDTSCRFTCDMRTPGPESTLEVSHVLVIEMVVSEEYIAPPKKPGAAPAYASATPTGSARVLRTQFQLTLTERAGMGISWDEESPPMYQDVPASPPMYKVQSRCEEFDITDLEE